MSYVTNVILHIGILENKDQKIEEVNTYFLDRDIYPLISVVDEKLPRDWYGGDKRLECNLYLGAFNYLYLDEFIAHLRTIQWKDPESLQLIIKEREDDKFRVIDILPNRYDQSQPTE